MVAAWRGAALADEVRGGGEKAFDPRFDDLLAPEVLTTSMRSLLRKTGDALDLASPVDLRSLRAVPVPADSSIAQFQASEYTFNPQMIGLGPVQVLVSPKLGAACLPVGSSPPAIVLGEAPAIDERAAMFLVLRALKLVHVRASALARTPPSELSALVSAWLKCFNPSWQPQGVAASALNAASGRLQAVLPRNPDPDVGVRSRSKSRAPSALSQLRRTRGIGVGRIAQQLSPALNDIECCALDAHRRIRVRCRPGHRRNGARSAAWLARTSEAALISSRFSAVLVSRFCAEGGGLRYWIRLILQSCCAPDRRFRSRGCVRTLCHGISRRSTGSGGTRAPRCPGTCLHHGESSGKG